MEQLKHFSHEHPLILNEDHPLEDVNCCGCNKSIVMGDSVYSCSISNGCDNFFLHKTCAELPLELEYPMHRNHRLSLHSCPQYEFLSCICNVCRVDDWKWFTYQCLSCQFDLCLTCVLQDRSFHDHEAQNHPLTLMPREATFRCDACDAEAKDLSYFCTTCLFWIHRSCASAPTTLKCEFHKEHPLLLAHSLPEQFCRFRQECSICNERVRLNCWLYYCADCRFFSHIKCVETVEPLMLRFATILSLVMFFGFVFSITFVLVSCYLPYIIKQTLDFRSIDEVDELNLVHFPMPDENSLSSLINQFVKDLSLADDSSRPADQIRHWAHPDHPLVLCDELNRSNTEMKYDEMLCDGCVRPLSVDAFYGCVQCNYFLHRFCADLPDELEHPSHPQHKLLIDQPSDPCETFMCDFCDSFFNGIHYYCKSCDFYIDIVCASLPSKIKHDSHEHPLNQLRIPRYDASEYQYSSRGFGCETCSFYLSKSRAINMPRTIRHRWDPHPLHLMYPPVKGHPHEFDCEMCSVDINPNYWFYHCRDCDMSFHVRCLLRDDDYLTFHFGCLLRVDFYSNVKFGAIRKVDDHQHSLTFVQNKRKRAVCSRCNKDVDVGFPALECAPCKYVLCQFCFS